MVSALFLLTGIHPAGAHHGRDFLVVQDYYLPGLLDGVLVNNFEMTRTGTDFEYGLEPEILIGILPRVAVGVSVGFVDQPGSGWTYDSVMPSVHIQLTRPDSDFPIRLAVSAAYEFTYESGAGSHFHGEPISAPAKKKSSGGGQSSKSGTGSSSKSTRKSSSSSGGLLSALKAAPKPPSAPAPVAEAPIPGVEVAMAPTSDPAPAGTDPVDLGPDAPPGGGSSGGGSSHDHSSHDHGGGSSQSHASHDHADSSDHAHASGETHDHAADEDHAHDETSSGGHHHGGGSIHSHGQDAFIGRLIMEADLSRQDKLVVNLINVTPSEGEGAWGYAAGVRHNLTHQFSLSLEAMGDFSEDGYHEINLGAFLVPDHHVTLRAGVGFGLTPTSPDLALRAGVVWRF